MIRLASPMDVDAIVELESVGFVPGDQWSRDSWAAELRVGDRFVGVVDGGLADQNVGIVGAITVHTVADTADLHRVVVHPAARGQGLGRVLVEAGISAAMCGGATRMMLEVAATNAAALRLYRAVGFAELARRPNYYAQGQDAIVMEYAWNR